MAENDLATAERRLNEAKVTFNIACLALTSTLTPFNAREGAVNRPCSRMTIGAEN